MSPLLLTLLLLPQSPAAAKYGMHPAKGRVAPSSAQPLPGALTQSSASTGGDECASPSLISGYGLFPYDNRFATTSAQGQLNCECFGFGSSAIADDIWLRWTAPASGVVTASLCANPGHDSRMAVYDAPGCPQGSPLACDDDWCGFVSASQVSWTASAGASYLLQIGNFSSGGGVAGSLSIQPTSVPANDGCQTPELIFGPGPHGFDNTSATTGREGQCEALCTSVQTTTLTDDVWFTWIADFDGIAQLSLCASAIDTRCAVYLGSGCPQPGSAIACDDDGCYFAGPSKLSFAASYGTSYLIQIGCFPSMPGGQGSFTIQNTSPNPLFTSVCVQGRYGVVPCPCANPPGNAGAGCNNSSNTGGALLSASGGASLSASALQLGMVGGRPTGATVLLQGQAELSLGIGSSAFGQGLRCVGSNLLRLYLVNAVSGAANFPPPGGSSVSARSAALGDVISPGSRRVYMCYYRDPIVLGGCAATRTFNASNGGIVYWAP
jgi:hypothetical protein